jgi:hypothetical protein
MTDSRVISSETKLAGSINEFQDIAHYFSDISDVSEHFMITFAKAKPSCQPLISHKMWAKSAVCELELGVYGNALLRLCSPRVFPAGAECWSFSQ